MISIDCQFNQFRLDEHIIKPKKRMQDFARQVTSAIRESLKKIQAEHKKEIVESAAFVVLQQNMAEFVHNTIDACVLNQLPLEKQFIHIRLPQKLHREIKILYRDSAGGFPTNFMEDKKSLDYFKDKLLGKKIYVPSQKEELGYHLIGGNGLALSQTCRFLKHYHGKLILKNTEKGAELQFISPPRPENKKPSFNNFKGRDFQNVFAHDEVSQLVRSNSHQELTLLNIPERNVTLQNLDLPRYNLSSTDSEKALSPFPSP